MIPDKQSKKSQALSKLENCSRYAIYASYGSEAVLYAEESDSSENSESSVIQMQADKFGLIFDKFSRLCKKGVTNFGFSGSERRRQPERLQTCYGNHDAVRITGAYLGPLCY